MEKCPNCGNYSLEREITTHGQGDEYDITVNSVGCPCGYGDADVY